MGTQIAKRYSSYKSQTKAFKLFLNFLPHSPHKTAFGTSFLHLEILEIEILAILYRFR